MAKAKAKSAGVHKKTKASVENTKEKLVSLAVTLNVPLTDKHNNARDAGDVYKDVQTQLKLAQAKAAKNTKEEKKTKKTKKKN